MAELIPYSEGQYSTLTSHISLTTYSAEAQV